MIKLRSFLLSNDNITQAEGDTSNWTEKGNIIKRILFHYLFVSMIVITNLCLTNNTFAAIALRGTATTATIAGTTLTITKPTGLAIGDVMIVQIVQRSDSRITALTDATATGWVEIAGSDIRSSSRSRCRATLLYKVANNIDIAAANFSFTMGAGSDDAEGGIIAYSGVNPLNIFDVLPGTVYTNINNDQQLNATAIITATANSAVIMFGALLDNQALSGWSIATTPTATTMAELFDVPYNAALDVGMGAAWATKATAGSTGNGTAAIAGNTNPFNGAILIALKAATGTTPSIINLSGYNCIGSSITITGTNLTGATAASVQIGGTPVTSITSNNGNVIVAVVGTGTSGLVTVGTPGGTAVSGSTFVVNAAPATPTITAGGPTTFCSGGSVTLTSSAGTTYLWSTGATSSGMNVTASGSYSVQVTNANGCQSAASAETVITVNALPQAVTVTPSNASICNGSVQQLTATNYVSSSPQSLSSGAISVSIPDNNATGATTALSLSGVPADAVVTGISVTFNITHTWDQDLIINVKAPNNNILNLVNKKGSSGDNFTNTIISSSSGTALSSGSAPFTGTYAADAAISVGPTSYVSNVSSFSGLYSVLNGDWVFAVNDAAAADIGTITSWSITINYTRPVVTWSPSTGLYTDAGAITSYSGGPATTVYAKPSLSQTYTATVTSVSGCTNSGSVSIAVTPTVGASAIPTPSASGICQGSANTIYTTSATNATSYTWSVTGTGNTISGTGTTGTVSWAPGFSGIATVSVIANGCGTSSPSSTTVTVTASVTPGVTISASANPVVSGTTVTFTPTPVNGGAPSYDWRVNGLSVGTSNTYSYTPNDLDQVYVIMTSTLSCVTTTGAKSNTITMDVNPLITSVSWTGTVNTDWNTPGNWAPAMVPGPGISATILNVANKPVISTAINVCENLTLGAGAVLTIAYNGGLTVNGVLNNNGASSDLVIQSTSSGTGSLITNGAVTGTATVQRFIGGASWGWHFLSSPVIAQAISPEFVASSSSTSEDFYSWSEPDQIWVNFKNTTVTPKWSDINGADFMPGRGYLVAYQATGNTKTFIGKPNSGLISYTLTTNGNGVNKYFNLVGNPYPCSIDWDAPSGWERSKLSGTSKSYWIWNDALGNYGAYITGSFGFGTNGVTNYISSGQGFMVLAESSGNLTMDNGIKAHNTQTYLKSTEISPEQLRIKLSCDMNVYSDETMISFNSSTPDEGSEKLSSMFTNAPELWSVKDGNKYSINLMGDISSAEIVPLSVKAGVAGTYTFTSSQVESFNGNSAISLEDRLTGTITYIGTTPSYTFLVSEPATITDRFFLHFIDVTGVPKPDIARNFNIYTTEGVLNIHSLQQMGGKIAVIDMLGRTVATGRVEAGATTRIDMHGNTGVYIVSLITGKGISNTKVIVK